MTKSRDVQNVIKSMGLERGTIHLFELVFEKIKDNKANTIELARQMDMMSNIITNFVGVADNMKKAIDAMQAQTGEDKYDLGENTQAIGRDKQ